MILRGVLSTGRYAKIRDLHAETGVELMPDHIAWISEEFYSFGVGASVLTHNLTRVRYDPDTHIKQ